MTKLINYLFPLQTLNSIAAEKNSTIIFPVPIDFVSQFANSNNARDERRAARSKPEDVPTKKEI